MALSPFKGCSKYEQAAAWPAGGGVRKGFPKDVSSERKGKGNSISKGPVVHGKLDHMRPVELEGQVEMWYKMGPGRQVVAG